MCRPWRPRDWPQKVVMLAEELRAQPEADIHLGARLTAIDFLYTYLIDSGKLEEGLACLEQLEGVDGQMGELDPRDLRNFISARRALHYALWNNDPIRAESILNLIPETSPARVTSSWLMSTALVQFCHENLEGALASIKAARSRLNYRRRDTGIEHLLLEWLDLVEQRVNQGFDLALPTIERGEASEPIGSLLPLAERSKTEP